MRTALKLALALTLFAPLGLGQAVAFTGEVNLDFPPSTLYPDPGGLEIGMPNGLEGLTPGWDIEHLGIAYDPATDSLLVGIDSAGVAGDPDGDADPETTSGALALLGGSDTPLWSGSETFSLRLDLDADGLYDVIVGLPLGADINGFVTATFTGPQSAPFGGFGGLLPQHAPALAHVPDAGHPDLEFTIPAFSTLLAGYVQPGQDSIGVDAFMGSLSDAGIGEDQFAGAMPFSIGFDALPCLPIVNRLEAMPTLQPVDNGVVWTTCYGLPTGYGYCILASLWDDPVGFPVTTAPGNPIIRIGHAGDLTTIFAADLGVPASSSGPVSLQQVPWRVPATIPSGTRIHVQMYAYPGFQVPGQAGLMLPHLASNRLVFEQP